MISFQLDHKVKSVNRLLPVSDRMYPCEKDVIIQFHSCLVLIFVLSSTIDMLFFYGLCLDNNRSISGQKISSQF